MRKGIIPVAGARNAYKETIMDISWPLISISFVFSIVIIIIIIE